MNFPKSRPAVSAKNLGKRVGRLLKESRKSVNSANQLELGLPEKSNCEYSIGLPRLSAGAFLDFISDAMPDGDVYLFGGVLRDMALFGKKGFNSDIDLVVEGEWSNLVPYLESLNASKNKFGGYRISLYDWPIDIWNAKDTWAIKEGFVQYNGIASLMDTTVLNWDSILMNWRTKRIICRESYFEDIAARKMDIVLKENPNPLGMAVRVFRYLCLKDARKVSFAVTRYLADCTKLYSFDEISKSELTSYKNSVITRPVYSFFKAINTSKDIDLEHQFSVATGIVMKEFGLTNNNKNSH